MSLAYLLIKLCFEPHSRPLYDKFTDSYSLRELQDTNDFSNSFNKASIKSPTLI